VVAFPRHAGTLHVLVAIMATPLAAATPPPLEGINLAAERAAIARFQDHDQRLQDMGWRLVRGNAAFCPQVIPSIGLQLQDAASYGRPEIARAALGLTGDFAVQTVAAGSPAQQAGSLTRNREITRLERFDPNGWPAGAQLDWQRLARAHDHITAMLTDHGGIAIGFADGAAVRVQPALVCATRFELMGEGTAAVADGTRVVIGIEAPGFADDDAMFAAMLAHELAHNLLGHAAWLDRKGRAAGQSRRTEREADRLMPWLLANAGFAPEVAVGFMQAWGPRLPAGRLIAPTHDSWTRRVRAIAAELPLIAAARAVEGEADWRRHFRREIVPDDGG